MNPKIQQLNLHSSDTKKKLQEQRQKKDYTKLGVAKKSSNPLVYPNPLTNCPTKPTYLINGQMGASPIRPN